MGKLQDRVAIVTGASSGIGMPQEQLFAIGRTFGIDPDQAGLKPGQQLPPEILERVAMVAKNFLMRPQRTGLNGLRRWLTGVSA